MSMERISFFGYYSSVSAMVSRRQLAINIPRESGSVCKSLPVCRYT